MLHYDQCFPATRYRMREESSSGFDPPDKGMYVCMFVYDRMIPQGGPSVMARLI